MTKKSKKNTLESVVDQLRQEISAHEILPGSRLQEIVLTDRFGVSRVVIREALSALEQRGLIKRIPNRGAVVTRVEPGEVMDIFSVREVLEGLCVRLATELAPDGAWDKHLKIFENELPEAIRNGEVEQYIDALDNFRADLVSYANNQFAEQFLDLILDKARVIARRVTILPGRAELGIEMHVELLKMMISRDAEGAEVQKRKIISSARDWFIRYKSFVV